MRTFSIAEQALNEPESGTTLAFGVDADDTSQVTLKLTHNEHAPITMRFRRNGAHVSTVYEVPETDEDVELRHKLHEANADVADAQQHHVMATGQSRPKDEREKAKSDYDAALKTQQEAQAALSERNLSREDEAARRSGRDPEAERAWLADPANAGKPTPDWKANIGSSAPPSIIGSTPQGWISPGPNAESNPMYNKVLSPAQAEQAADISRGEAGTQRAKPDAELPDSLKSYNQPSTLPRNV